MIGRLAPAAASLAALLALSSAAFADDEQAPPVLTPFAAGYVARGCPDAKPYADALVRGITLAEAKVAAPVLARCANAIRLFELQWKNTRGAFGLAAVELSEGLLEHDPALLKRAADATRALRDASLTRDSEIRSWDKIPDWFYAQDRKAIVFDNPLCLGDIAVNAAYMNLVARSGTAWIRTPRVIPPPDKAPRCPVSPVNPPPLLPQAYGLPAGIPSPPTDLPLPPERPAPGLPPR